MKHFIFALILFSSELFFGFSAIRGVAMSEDGAGASYKFFCIGVFVLFILTYLSQYTGRSIRSRHFGSLFILLLYGVIGIVSGYTTDVSMLTFVAYSIPAAGIAIYYAEHNNICKLIKWIDVILPIVSISLLFSLRLLIVSIAEGENSYSQTLSYEAAYCFVLYLFFLLFGGQYERFPIFNGKWYKYLSIIMLPYLVVVLFFSGGRGAFGTLAAGTLILLFLYHKHHRISIPIFIRNLIVLGIFAVIVISIIPDNARGVFTDNMHRVFSFFDKDLDMYSRTSGRDEVMAVAIEQIKANPILGSGLFAYKDLFVAKTGQGYPHNFFIEVLLQGGVVFLFVVLFLLIISFNKLVKIARTGRQELLIIFGVYAMTCLMYSGSYMQEPFFWFFFIYIYNFSLKNNTFKIS